MNDDDDDINDKNNNDNDNDDDNDNDNDNDDDDDNNDDDNDNDTGYRMSAKRLRQDGNAEGRYDRNATADAEKKTMDFALRRALGGQSYASHASVSANDRQIVEACYVEPDETRTVGGRLLSLIASQVCIVVRDVCDCE